MPQPLNRFELTRLKSNNFKKNSFKLSSASIVKEKVVFDSLRRVRIEDVTDVEQTFSVILTSTPVIHDSTNNFDNTTSMSLCGGSWPNIDSVPYKLDNYSLTDKIFTLPIQLAFQIKDQPYLNFDLDYPGEAYNYGGNIIFELKRNRKYRFDLSHPSLSVNETQPYVDGFTQNTRNGWVWEVDTLPELRLETVNEFKLYRNAAADFNPFPGLSNHYDLSAIGEFLIEEGVTQNGKPGTSGAYLDIITHDKLPDSLFIFNSALPTHFTNSGYTSSYGPIFRNIKTKNIPSGIILNLYNDKTDDFIVNGLNGVTPYAPKDKKIIGDPMSLNDSSFISAANVFENFDIEEKWLDTRTRTITSFIEKVMKKVKPGNPLNIIPALSSLHVRFDHFKNPEDYFYSNRHNSNYGKLLFHRDNTNLIFDYFNPIIRDTSNHRVSAWNPKWWGYEARDVLDFSGVSVDMDGIPNGAQTVLITPKHMIAGAHWGKSETPQPGDTIYFLEKNTGLRVSANVIQQVRLMRSGTNPDPDLTYIDQLSNFENYNSEPWAIGDSTVFKLDRDVTQPDPNVPGSDGSVKVYKMFRFNQPLMWNDHPNRTTPDYIQNNNSDFRLSGSDIISTLPRVGMYGHGAFGRSSWYNHGDEYVKMGMIGFRVNWYLNNTPYSTLYTDGSGVGDSVHGNYETGNSFNNFNILSSNPFLEYEAGDITKPRLRLDDISGVVVGDSSNPHFILAETKEHELQLLGPWNMTTSAVPMPHLKPKNFVERWPAPEDVTPNHANNIEGEYTSIDNILNSMFYSMSGGNPEGYTVGVVDLN